ncbi:hypothetical protein [Asanoa sp. NPDC050611]|uniref:hypothetical protein n=1 Tax=Asanoa sp. NPDC050611 TaxID=3157098 RepID=UPI003403E7AC
MSVDPAYGWLPCGRTRTPTGRLAVSQPTERAAVLRRLLRAGAIAVAVIVVTVLAFAPSAEGQTARPAPPEPAGWPVVSLVALAVLAVIIPTAVVVALRRRRY